MAVRGIRTLSRAHQVSLSCRQQSTDVHAGATTIEAARPWEDIPSLPWVPIVGNIALAFKCVFFFLPSARRSTVAKSQVVRSGQDQNMKNMKKS